MVEERRSGNGGTAGTALGIRRRGAGAGGCFDCSRHHCGKHRGVRPGIVERPPPLPGRWRPKHTHAHHGPQLCPIAPGRNSRGQRVRGLGAIQDGPPPDALRQMRNPLGASGKGRRLHHRDPPRPGEVRKAGQQVRHVPCGSVKPGRAARRLLRLHLHLRVRQGPAGDARHPEFGLPCPGRTGASGPCRTRFAPVAGLLDRRRGVANGGAVHHREPRNYGPQERLPVGRAGQ